MAETSSSAPINGLQQWRELCYMTTLDVSDPERLLAITAQLLCAASGASGCVITYRSPYGMPVEVVHGLITGDTRLLMAQAQSRFAPSQLLPVTQSSGEMQLVTVPLTMNREGVGMLHLVVPGPSIAMDDLQIVTVMLTNALSRQVATEQASRSARRIAERQLAVQKAITRVLAESATLGDATPIILQALSESLGWDLAEFWSLDQSANVLRLSASWHATDFDPAEFTAFHRETTYARGVGVPGRVWAAGEAASIAEVMEDHNFPGALIAARNRLHSAFAFPILSGSEISGVIALYRRTTVLPDPYVAVMLTSFGGQIGQFIERKRAEVQNAQLVEALRVERNRLLRREVEVRTQIGRDLHDGPVQQVAVAALTVQYVRRVVERAPEQLNAALDDLEAHLRRTTQDLRTVLYELRPLGIVEEGLVKVLQQYVAKLGDVNGLRIHLHAPETLPRIDPDHEAAIFIIIQEAINNARKHARASDLWIDLRDDGAAIHAEVRDNGSGFDVQRVSSSYLDRGSFGLLNMADRAQLLGGSCTITSEPSRGTIVQLRVPYAEPRERAAGNHITQSGTDVL